MVQYQCPECRYTYDEVDGHPYEGFPPGTPWSAIPENWSCPRCAVRDKADFVCISGPAGERPAAAVIAPESEQPTSDIPTPVAPKSAAPYQKYQCLTCGHIYDESLGDEDSGLVAGTRFEDIPEYWCCPECGATKEAFVLYVDN